MCSGLKVTETPKRCPELALVWYVVFFPQKSSVKGERLDRLGMLFSGSMS